MDKRKRERFKRRLLKERGKISKEIENLENDSSKEQKELAGGSSGYAYHLADVASDSYNREFNLNLASNEEKILYQIDKALKKIEKGDFGKCENCGKKINEERLKTILYAQLCIQCQQKEEKNQ